MFLEKIQLYIALHPKALKTFTNLIARPKASSLSLTANLDSDPRGIIAETPFPYQSSVIPSFFFLPPHVPAEETRLSSRSSSFFPLPTRWIFHLPFVQASHSWRPASLNISPFALFIIGLEFARFSSSFPSSPTFTTPLFVHRHDDVGLAVSRACTRADAHATRHMHLYTHTHELSAAVSREIPRIYINIYIYIIA